MEGVKRFEWYTEIGWATTWKLSLKMRPPPMEEVSDDMFERRTTDGKRDLGFSILISGTKHDKDRLVVVPCYHGGAGLVLVGFNPRLSSTSAGCKSPYITARFERFGG
ncbi:MAG: hypothetical protein R2911_13515 [Caldilineaceae bacterium]